MRMDKRQLRIHGDNIVECERTLKMIAEAFHASAELQKAQSISLSTPSVHQNLCLRLNYCQVMADGATSILVRLYICQAGDLGSLPIRISRK